jgi:urease accessory protein
MRLSLTALLILIPTAALAHTGAGSASGFVHGFAHPVGGLDHILAMVTVGLLAWQLGGRALWLVPSAFVAAMALGGWLGLMGIALPHVEIGIALSVVVLGAIVALGIKTPLAITMGLAALFAIFHGHAHGSELPHGAAAAAYAAGFLLATALLHANGIALGFLIAQLGRVPIRIGGGLVSLAGVAILAGMI